MSDERGGVLSASGFASLALCQKKFQMESGLPEGESTKDALSGNACHDWLEGKTDTALTPDEFDLVRRAREQATAMRLVVFGNDKIAVTKREARLWSSNGKFSGKPDLIYVNGGTALILDYKTGRIPVEPADENWQLKGYATLVAQNWPVERVFVSIVQPHCGEPTLHKYEGEALRRVRRQVHALVRRANGPRAKLNPGEKQCKYCRAKSICPALQEQSLELSQTSGTDVATFDGERLSQLLDQVRPVEEFIKALRLRARDMLSEDKQSVPNYTLKEGTRRRKISDNKKVYDTLTASGVPLDDIIAAASFSVARIERLARERDNLSAREARDLVEDALGGLIEVSQSDPKLEREVA
tara:strand:+ start:163 stop:1230 length:1068 start_codon:yes stop_codon:yes gene_type:complete